MPGMQSGLKRGIFGSKARNFVMKKKRPAGEQAGRSQV